MRKSLLSCSIVLASLGLLAGCSEPSSSASSSTSSGSAEKVDLTGETLRFVGSTSVENMSKSLSTAWQNTFDSSNKPGVDHNHTGSGDAYTKVKDGTGDIGLASREFKDTEKGEGFADGKICRDGIAVIVNAENPLANITIQQLRDIYVSATAIADGETSVANFGTDYSAEDPIVDWNAFGDSFTGKINPYTRDTTSGTRDGFCTKIGIENAKTKDDLLSANVSQVASNGDMIAKVENDKYGIGYCSLEGLESHPKVKAIKVENVEATADTIRKDEYPLQRNFNYMYPTAANGRSDIKMALIDSFIAYMGSAEGQGIVTGEGGILDATTALPEHYADIVAKADWAVTLGLR